MDLNKKRLLLNVFFISEFNYCHLVWMCHNDTEIEIIRLHERCLCLIYIDKKSSLEELLEIGSCVLMHSRNLKTLAIEIYKRYQGHFTNYHEWNIHTKASKLV